jgi:hypothetical protein
MNFYDNRLPSYCASPGTSLSFGKAMPGVVGKLLTGTWRPVITRTDSIFLSGSPKHAQGGAIVNNYTLTATTDAPAGVDLRLISLGLGVTDTCKTLGTGNRNGFLDPLESGNFQPQIFNNGCTTATTTNIRLSSSSSALAFSPGGGQSIANIPPGATVSPSQPIQITSSDSACNNLPLTVSLTGSSGFSQDIVTTLQEGRPTSATTDLATAISDLSASNTPGASPWLVSNATGATFNGSVSRYDYPQCGFDATLWPAWTGPPVSPKPNSSEPYLMGSLFTSSNCVTRTNPGASLPDPICFYTAGPNNSLMGNGVNYIHLDASAMSWGLAYDAACTDVNSNNPPAGLDARLTSNPVNIPLYSKVQLIFPNVFWTYWDVFGALEPVQRDNIASVEVASSLTDAAATCPLDTACPLGALTCRHWCEVFRVQNHSTPFILDSLVDVSAYANNATNVQVRFRFRDAGWYQSQLGDEFWALRNIKLQGVGAPTISCNTCAPCSAPTFTGIQSAVDPDGCLDTGVNLGFNNPTDPNWNDCPAGGSDCVTAQPLRHFDIYRSDAPAVVLQSVPWSSASSFTINDNTAANGTNFTYRVVAVNGCANTADGGGATRTVQDHIGVVPAFAGISAASDNNTCLASGVTVTWATPSDWGDQPGLTTTRQYVIQRDIGAGFVTLATLVNPGATISYNDTTVPANTPATYQVIATNRCPLSTGAGITHAATDLAASAPSGFANNTATDNNICLATGNTVTWTAPTAWNDNGIGVDTFTVLRGGVAIGSGPCSGALSAATVSCNDTSAVANTAYTYRVRANNGCVLTATTSPGAAATDTADVTPPPAITNNLAAKSGSNLSLTWDAASDSCGITNYKVYANAAPTPLTTVFGTPAATTITDPLASGNNYYQVTAVDGGGNESPR